MEASSQTFHRYHLINPLFRGLGHDTYLAYPADQPGQYVVLKIFTAASLIPGTTLSDVRQLEAQLQRLQHPHIVPVFELSIEQGIPYLARAYSPGGSLRQYLDQRASGRLPLEEAVGVVMQVGRGLALAHTQGMLHRRFGQRISCSVRKARCCLLILA
jgi:serine/threonine protein kinase